jgi:DNA helicase IV
VEHEEHYDPTAELRDETVREVTTVDDQEPRRLRTTTRTDDDPHAHVLVDEAQDLSPMQWRMLGRRGRYASWTVVGDPAQSSWPHAEEAEQARAEALGDKDAHTFRLSTNYRNSAEIYDFAARVARAAVDHPDLPDAVRRTGEPPQHRTVATGQLRDSVRAAVAEMRAAVEGTIGVVAPTVRRAEVGGWLTGETDARVRVLEPLDTKGLEFDAIVVVQPGEIAGESATGMRTLYVVLTRATQRLVTVSTDDSWMP